MKQNLNLVSCHSNRSVMLIPRKRSISVTLLICFFSLSVSACSQSGFNKTTTGTVVGTTLGAGLGAIIGSQTGHAGPGIAIGAAAGALGGAIAGNTLDNNDAENDQLRSQIQSQQEQIRENQKLIEELRRSGADVRQSDRGVVVNLPDVLFHFDSSQLTTVANDTISEISRVLRDVKHRSIAVEGHTDSIGDVEYNKRLSRRRAESVARSLSRGAISRQQMSVVGYGESSPIATNNSAEGRARNRRVEVIVEN